MPDITLYSARTCPFAQRTRLMLAIKQTGFELTEIDLKNTPDWFHDISPYGKVPVLQHGDDRVWESAIINEYLEESYPQPALLPSAPGERAYARFWIDFANTQFVPLFYKVLLEQDPDRQRQRRDEMIEKLRFMENEGLGNPTAGDFWLGDQVSLVDLAFYPFFERFCVLEHYRQLQLPDDCPRLAAWWQRMTEQPAIREIANPADFYIRSYRHYADGTAQGRTAQEMRDH